MQNMGVIGSRSLSRRYSSQVSDVVKYLLDRGFNITTGGAVGTDQFCLEAVVSLGQQSRCVVFAAWQNIKDFPVKEIQIIV